MNIAIALRNSAYLPNIFITMVPYNFERVCVCQYIFPSCMNVPLIGAFVFLLVIDNVDTLSNKPLSHNVKALVQINIINLVASRCVPIS